MNTPTAPYEVASDYRTVRIDDYLYLDGKKYRCPVLSGEEVIEISRQIREHLHTEPTWLGRLLMKLWRIK